jgi:hypothetical protein
VAIRHPGWGPIFRYSPPLSVLRAAAAALVSGSAARFVYDIVYETGMWVGAARFTLGIEGHAGK